MHIVRQLCDIFFSLFLSYLCDICWTCWVFTGVTTGVFAPPPQRHPPPLFSAAPCAPSQWIHLHPDYRTNCHAGRKANQILRQQLGEEIAFPLCGREARPIVPELLALFFFFDWRKRSRKGWKGERHWAAAAGQVRKPPAGQVSPISLSIFTLHSLPYFPLHSSWHYLSVTRRHQGLLSLPAVLRMKRNNNYGDRVALAAKPGPLGSQQHIVQPDYGAICGIFAVVKQSSSSCLKPDLAARCIDMSSNLRSVRKCEGQSLHFFTGSLSWCFQFFPENRGSRVTHQCPRLSPRM